MLLFVSVLLAFTLPQVNWRLGVFHFAPCFTSGIVAYDLARRRTGAWKLPAWVWPAGIIAAIVLFGPHDNVSLPYKFYRAWGLSMFLGALYVNVKESENGWLHSIFHWVAERSYGIYLSHTVVFWIVFYRMAQLPKWEQVLALLIGAIGIPAFLYVLVEKPLMQVGVVLSNGMLSRTVSGKNEVVLSTF